MNVGQENKNGRQNWQRLAGDQDGLVELSAEIVSAYVAHNAMSSADLPRFIGEVHAALKRLGSVEEPEAPKGTEARRFGAQVGNARLHHLS